MEGIKNLLTYLELNWTSILICIGLIIGIAQKTINFFSLSKEKRIELAKKQIQEVILRMISDAETDYSDMSAAGKIKRSQVIEEIYDKYPILEKVADQDALITWIDEQIDKALVTLREIIEKNKEE
jgi:hypothetical protein